MNRPLPNRDCGVIFDVDGVLIDSARPHLESWRRLAAENGAAVSEELFLATFGRQNRDIVPLIFGAVSPNRLRALADRKEAIYRELIRNRPPIVPGAVELVRGLAEAGVAVGIGSSGPPENIALVLSAMGIREVVSAIVTGDDVTRGKPDPQVFSLACERLGLAPDRCIVVEDAPAGVAAAKTAGTRVVALLMHHPRSAFAEADWVVEKLSDLRVETILDWLAGTH